MTRKPRDEGSPDEIRTSSKHTLVLTVKWLQRYTYIPHTHFDIYLTPYYFFFLAHKFFYAQ